MDSNENLPVVEDISFIDEIDDNCNNKSHSLDAMNNNANNKNQLQSIDENHENHESHQPHELSFSSDDTVFLNLPPTCTQSMPTLQHFSTSADSIHIQSNDNGEDHLNSQNIQSSTSTTPTPTTSLPNAPSISMHLNSDNNSSSTTSTPINDLFNSYTELSSTDEDTSFYKDKCSMISSTFDHERQLPSDYFGSSRGAYTSIK